MKWIKASDRLPDTRVIVRWVSPAGGPYIEIGDGDWIKGYETAGHYAPDSLEDVEWLDESTLSPTRGLQDRNFMVRLKANIDRRMTDTGVKEMMLDGSSAKKIFSDTWTAFFESLEDITLGILQGKEPNPWPSRGFTEMKLFSELFSEYKSITGSPYCQIPSDEDLVKRCDKFLASLPLQSNVEGEDWMKCEEGNPLPDCDMPVLWLQENGNMVVEALDKDGNPWIFEEQTFEGSYMGNKATHWKRLPKSPTDQC